MNVYFYEVFIKYSLIQFSHIFKGKVVKVEVCQDLSPRAWNETACTKISKVITLHYSGSILPFSRRKYHCSLKNPGYWEIFIKILLESRIKTWSMIVKWNRYFVYLTFHLRITTWVCQHNSIRSLSFRMPNCWCDNQVGSYGSGHQCSRYPWKQSTSFATWLCRRCQSQSKGHRRTKRYHGGHRSWEVVFSKVHNILIHSIYKDNIRSTSVFINFCSLQPSCLCTFSQQIRYSIFTGSVELSVNLPYSRYFTFTMR